MNLSAKQKQSISEANQKINLWVGAVRSGKSHAALHAFLYFVRKGPPGPLLITGRSTNTIERNVIEPIRELVGPYAKYKRGIGELDLLGRTIYVVGAADERSEGRIRGSTFVGTLVDEVTILPESFFKMLLSRLSLPGAQLFGTSNPDSPHHWLKRDFLDHKETLPLASWNFTLEDNPSLSAEYVRDLKKFYQGLWYTRFVEGKWVMAEGAIYDFFDETIHVIQTPPAYAKYYIVGIDYGTTNPFAATMIGFNDDVQPSLWVEREYYYSSKAYNASKTDAEYARDMKVWLSDYPVKAIYLDPSAASFRLELKRLLPRQVIKDANNDVLNGIRCVATNLSQGTLKICSECKELIREMQSYCWDERASRLGKEAPVKASDHLADCVRYACLTHWGEKKSLKEKTEDERKLESYGRMSSQEKLSQTWGPGWQRY